MSAMLDFLKTLFAPADDEPGRDPNDVRTTFLFVEPSWLSGAGRIADLWGGSDHFMYSKTGDEADRLALYSDWRIIGQDIRNAVATLSCREVSGGVPVCCLVYGARGQNPEWDRLCEAVSRGNTSNGVYGTNGAAVNGARNGVQHGHYPCAHEADRAYPFGE